MTFAVFQDFPRLENGLPKFQDFSWLSRTSGHPVQRRRNFVPISLSFRDLMQDRQKTDAATYSVRA